MRQDRTPCRISACTPPWPAPCSTNPAPAVRPQDVERLRRAPSARVEGRARAPTHPPGGPAVRLGRSSADGAGGVLRVRCRSARTWPGRSWRLNRLVLSLAALYGGRPGGRERMAGVAVAAGAGLASEALRQGLVRLLRRIAPAKLGRADGRRRRWRAARSDTSRPWRSAAGPASSSGPAGSSRPFAARSREPHRRRRHRRRRADRMLPRGRARVARSDRSSSSSAPSRAARPPARPRACCRLRPTPPSRRRSSISLSKAGTSIRTGRGGCSRRPASTSGTAARGCCVLLPARRLPSAERAADRAGSGRAACGSRSWRASSCRREIGARLAPRGRGASVFYPDEAVVDPRRATRAAWLLAERRGARVETGTSVRRFSIERGVCRGVETDAGSIASRRRRRRGGSLGGLRRESAGAGSGRSGPRPDRGAPARRPASRDRAVVRRGLSRSPGGRHRPRRLHARARRVSARKSRPGRSGSCSTRRRGCARKSQRRGS